MKFRSIPALGLAGAMLVAGTPAASAQTSVRLVAGGTYTGVLVNGLTVAYDCTAAGAGDIVAVAITRCQLTTSPENKTIALPGAVATIGGVSTVPIRDFQLCYSAEFTFLDASRRTVSGCNPLIASVGGIPQLVGAGVTTA